ncbi:DUF1499 domain-containing protein [Aromatoleum toluclasticum]|uniref:DUF1499 domain-containing protein n=1 Tax=Aromatoleum toluclasticum TaxID=92003 RepID=UPI000382EB37|nr:DUF1499 domain-containing protein [Aromatoleum toluclasticum]
MKLSHLTLAVTLLGGMTMFVSGSGTRFGLWPFPVGFQLLTWAAFLGLAAAAVGLAGLLLPKLRGGQSGVFAVSLVLGLAVAAIPAYWLQQARTLPAIHDISTDAGDPPAFAAALARRGETANPVIDRSMEVAEAQRLAYPDIQPLTVPLAPPAAFARAVTAAKGMGWELIAQDEAAGRIEATATTMWFGFKDDVVVRITPSGGGSRIDVRSVSRVGVSDVGANAKRIRAYLAKLRR